MTPSVDVVIPVYGHWDLTARCLATLAPRDPCIRSVIVVDDGSPDDSAARLRERRDVRAVVLEQNRGFAGACNAGAAAGDADLIFFLNNDTLVPPGTIERLAQRLAASGAAANSPKLVHGDGTLQATALALLAHAPHFERLHVYLDPDLPQANVGYDPLALCGAALLVRRDAFDAVGRFDESYRNGCEDLDLSLMLWSAGYRLRYEPDEAIVHLEGASRGKMLDDAPNQRRLAARWAHAFGTLPRWQQHDSPVLDIRWTSADPLERSVRSAWYPPLKAHAGARIVYNAPAYATIVAPLDRRRRLAIEHRGRGAPADVAWCAPTTPDDARRLRARGVRTYWVASERGRALLIDAGVAAERVHVTRPGFAPPPQPRSGGAIVVRSAATAADGAAAVARACAPLPTETIVAERADRAALARVRHAALVAFVDDGDPWGLLGTAALSAGAAVIAPPSAPFVEFVPVGAYAAAADPMTAAEAAHALASDPEAARALGARAATELARRHPDVYAGRRLRELARAEVHGVVDPRTLAMGLERARGLAPAIA